MVLNLDGTEHDNGEQAEEMLPTWGEALIRPEKGNKNLELNTLFFWGCRTKPYSFLAFYLRCRRHLRIFIYGRL